MHRQIKSVRPRTPSTRTPNTVNKKNEMRCWYSELKIIEAHTGYAATSYEECMNANVDIYVRQKFSAV